MYAVSVARAEPGVAKGSAAAFARSASFFICIALLLGGFFFVVGFFVLLSMEFWRENCGLPPTRGREISCACSCGHSEPERALSLSLLRFAILRRRARESLGVDSTQLTTTYLLERARERLPVLLRHQTLLRLHRHREHAEIPPEDDALEPRRGSNCATFPSPSFS